jgi:DNA mismatch repair ATPase MutL
VTEQWGFRIACGNITHVPDFVKHRIDLVNDILTELTDGQCMQPLAHPFDDPFDAVSFIPRVMLDILNSTACRGAIMFGDVLTPEQATNVLDGLKRCRLPFYCAHGRPTMAFMASFSS